LSWENWKEKKKGKKGFRKFELGTGRALEGKEMI